MERVKKPESDVSKQKKTQKTPDSPASDGAAKANALKTEAVASAPIKTGQPETQKAPIGATPSKADSLETTVVSSKPLRPEAEATKPDATTSLPEPAKAATNSPAHSSVPKVSPKSDAVTGAMKTSDSSGSASSTATAKPETPPAKPQPAPVTVKKTGFFPTFLGGVVAAGLGAGATLYALPHLPEAWRPASAPAVDVAALKAEMTQIADEAAKTAAAGNMEAARTAATEAAQAALANLPAPADAAPVDLSGIESTLSAQAEQIKALDAALTSAGQPAGDGTAAAGPAAQAGLEATLKELQERLSAQDARINEQAARPENNGETPAELQALAAQIEATAAAAREQIAAAEAEATKLKSDTEEAGRKARAAGALALYQAALDSGAPRDAALADLQASGVELPAAITADTPTLSDLRRDFDPAARQALAVSLRAASSQEDTMGRIGNFLRVQTGARSVEPKDGDGPDAVLSRAAAQVQSGDIPAALSEVAKLPEPGQQAMSGWTSAAQAYVATRAAIADLSAALN